VTPAPGRSGLLAAATGAGGGFFSGLTGVGGGAIMVPLMTGVLRMRQHTAHGTSLVVIIFAAGASAAVYGLREGIAWALVASLLPASVAGAYTGARVVQHVPAMRLRQVFGVFVLLLGLRLLLFPGIEPLLTVSGVREVLASAAIGFAGGFLSGALGVGGGAIFVPALVLILGAGQHEAQGASLCVIVAAALVGAATHRRHGSIDMHVARWVAMTAVPAGMFGAWVASGLHAATLQRVFAAVAVAVGIQVLTTATLTLRRERREALALPGAVEGAA